MSEENVEVVRRGIEAWNRRDLTTWLATFRSDAEIDWSRARAPFKGVYRGYGGLEGFWGEFWSTFEGVQIEKPGFPEAGPRAVGSTTPPPLGRRRSGMVAQSVVLLPVVERS